MNCDLILPMPAERLLPHRTPMLLVKTLLSSEFDAGRVEACLDHNSIVVDSRGKLDEVVLVELLAQGYAAIMGYGDLVNGRPVHEGFLVGLRKLSIYKEAFAGERLVVGIRTVGTFEGFAVVEGEISRGDDLIAAGTIKLLIAKDRTVPGGES
jgi:predicted hotdog family 3-hydroxylacyl-ACP dehydratase